MNDSVHEMGLSRIDSLMMKWTFKHGLGRTAYTKEQFNDFIAKTKFRRCEFEGQRT